MLINLFFCRYRAPELLIGEENYGLAIDLWSVGCILCEICTKTAIFKGDSQIDQLFKIFQYSGTPTATNKIWP